MLGVQRGAEKALEIKSRLSKRGLSSETVQHWDRPNSSTGQNIHARHMEVNSRLGRVTNLAIFHYFLKNLAANVVERDWHISGGSEIY